jgi:hypothetical protein
MKRKLLLVLSIVILCSCITSCNSNASLDNNNCSDHIFENGICTICRALQNQGLSFRLNDDKNSYMIDGIGKCKDTEIHIPDEYEGKPVTSICARAFEDCEQINSVIVGESVIEIGSSAFEGCKNLTNISLSDSIVCIRAGAFSNTGYYSDKANWDNGVIYIDNHLIKATYELSDEYQIKQGTTTIADYAFENCFSLRNVIIPDSLIYIGRRSFSDCAKLTNVTIPDNVKVIGEGCFSSCDNLKSIKLPSELKEIKADTFSFCSNLENISLPNSITEIGDDAFKYCDSLTQISIPSNVKTINKGVFSSCDNLKSVSLPDGITSIKLCAFADCGNLQTINIPKSVTSIEMEVFWKCSKLKQINFDGTKNDWYNIPKDIRWNYHTGNYTIYCTDGNINK